MRFLEVGFASYSFGLSEEEREEVAKEIVSLPEEELLKDCNFQCPNCYANSTYCSNHCSNHSAYSP